MAEFSNFRLDRALSIGLAHPISLMLKRNAQVPVLMYHSICDALGDKHPYFETNTSPRRFAQQMRFLHDNGYRATDLAQALTSIQAGTHDDKQVVITFDDGYRDFYTQAFPVLLQYCFTATIFVVTGVTGEHNISRNGKVYMTWEEIRQVHANGVHIGSHTVTHPELETLDAERVKCEIWKSKKIIEENLGNSVQSFSYPYAFPEQNTRVVALVRDALKESGYESGVSTIIGRAGRQHDRFFLPRLPVSSYDDQCLFRAKLEGGYNWVHAPQRLYKTLRKKSSRSPRQVPTENL